MKNWPNFLLRCSVFAFMPLVANAAGTYYNGNYQSPQQQRYNNYQSYSSQQQRQSYSNANTSAVRSNPNARVYSAWQQQPGANNTNNAKNSAQSGGANDGTNGFSVGAGFSRQFAMWQFEMKDAGSILHYDDINWNVFDINAGYKFNAGNVKMGIEAGFQYGVQSGEDSYMVDDDISNGGYLSTSWYDDNDRFIGDQFGHALSVGTSKDGSMMGFYAGVGLPDFFKLGNVRVTPSVGYRYLKYKLETKSNYGLSVETASCFDIDGEIQCDPAIILYNIDALGNVSQQYIIWRQNWNDKLDNIDSYKYFNTGDTYYYEQPGTSHSYEVEWTGPYLALDMDYLINKNNAVNGRVELGLPSYTATGDQPYRFDWAHPKSVEDKASMGDAYHLGLGANWKTALTDSITLSVGVTYDYYTVSGANAKTYLNEAYYTDIYNAIYSKWVDAGYTQDDMLGYNDLNGNNILDDGDPTAIGIVDLLADCPGWVCDSGGIDSFYKSLGVRVGINAKF